MIDLKNIKNIIFDLGGVILNVDYLKTIEAFKQIGIIDYDKIYTQNHQNELFNKIEKGTISMQGFRNEIRKLSVNNITDDQIDEAWNSMVLDFPPERFDLLKELKNHFNCYLLSNTNEIHFIFYTNLLYKTFKIKNLSELFLKEYYSHIIGMRKPDIKFYELVLNENQLIPSETLFIDDTAINIEIADKTGINTYLLQKNETICKIFKNYI